MIADAQWKTVKREDRQNQQLLDLSNQILQLTREVRAFGDTIASESDQNKQLIELSRETLTLTRQIQARAVAAGAPGPAK